MKRYPKNDENWTNKIKNYQKRKRVETILSKLRTRTPDDYKAPEERTRRLFVLFLLVSIHHPLFVKDNKLFEEP